MKTFLSLTLLILMSSTLVSCSGGKAEMKLEISRGFLVSGSGFDGGLIISGKNTQTGQSFTKSLTSGLSVSLFLDAGPWTISAIGWDGDPHTATGNTPELTKVFAGKPSCGKVSANLSSTNSVLNMTITQANCGTADFAGSYPDSTIAGTPTIPKLNHVMTCSTFFGNPGPSDTVSGAHVNAVTSLNFCTTVSSDLKSKAQSMRIHSLDKGPDDSLTTIGFASDCIVGGSTERNIMEPMKSGGPTNPYDATNWELRIPLKSIPVFITLFRNTNCTEPVGEYIFQNGIETMSEEYDSALYADGANTDAVRLYLPGNDLRRARSSFQHLLPSFTDSSNMRFATAPPTIINDKYHAFAGIQKVVELDRNDCVSFGTHTNVSGTPVCTDLGDRVEIKFTAASPGSGTVGFSSGTNLNFEAEPPTGQDRYQIQKLMWKLTGPDSEIDDHRNFWNEGKENDLADDDHGALSRVRSMLMGNGAGGILGVPNSHFTTNLTFTQSCMAAVGDKTVKIFNFDEAAFETYRVKVSTLGTPSATTSLFCDDNSYGSNCATTPNTLIKRMHVWDYKSDLVQPVIVMEFDCTKMVGTFESRFPKTDYGLNLVNRSRLDWNTEINTKQRFDLLEWRLGKTAANVPVVDKRGMYRIVKDGSGDYYAAWGITFHSQFNGSNYDEDFRVDEFRYGSIGGIDVVDFGVQFNGIASTYEDAFVNSGVNILAIRTAFPIGSVGPLDLQDQFNRSSSYPQTPAGLTTTDAYSLSNFTNGANLIFGLPMNPGSLDSSFKSKFGTSFYTNP